MPRSGTPVCYSTPLASKLYRKTSVPKTDEVTATSSCTLRMRWEEK